MGVGEDGVDIVVTHFEMLILVESDFVSDQKAMANCDLVMLIYATERSSPDFVTNVIGIYGL